MAGVFRGGVVRTNFKNYPLVLGRVVRSIKKIGPTSIKKLSKIHLDETKRVINNSIARSNAREALISHLEYKDNNKQSIKILSVSNVGAFFEFGVRPHPVYSNMDTISGGLVSTWMTKNGLDAPFIVGKPGTIMDKNNPLLFMGKGYDLSASKADGIVYHQMKNI